MSTSRTEQFIDALGHLERDVDNVIVDGDRVALEWSRQGTAHDGGAMDYVGVSVIEFADDGVVRFMGYFHPRELGRQTQ